MSANTVQKSRQSTKYKSLGLVGQGQFGQVYCAIHRKTGRLVALKNLNRDRFATHQFLRELRFLLSLDHPHIANCLALDQSGNGRQLVLDYCEGGTLRDVMEQGVQLTLAEILQLLTEVLSALEHAQHKNIVHCDIKPENILLTLSPDGWRAKVSDFGIARLSQEFQQNHTGATGSPAYMAPERFYFQSSAASDLYAVGIILYELLLGDRPFSGNYNQLMVCHLNHAIALPTALPPGIQAILKKSTEKLTPRRFRSAADMQAALIAVRKTLTTEELRDRYPKPVPPSPSGRWRSPSPLKLPASCQAIALLDSDQPTPKLLTTGGQMLHVWSLSNTGQIDEAVAPQIWQFDAPITQLSSTIKGVLVNTGRQLYHLTAAGRSQLAEFDRPIVIMPGSQRWAFLQALDPPPQLWLMDTWQRVTPRPQSLPALEQSPGGQGVALDDRHYVTATVDGVQSTFHIMTRKGLKLGKLGIQVPIHQLFGSSQSAHFLAVAGTQKSDFLVVKLQPYRIMRCRLDITIHWLGELVVGFAAISPSGQMRLVNDQGQIIGQVENLPSPRAIAFHPPYQIWLASEQNGSPQLHRIDIRELGLDIIF